MQSAISLDLPCLIWRSYLTHAIRIIYRDEPLTAKTGAAESSVVTLSTVAMNWQWQATYLQVVLIIFSLTT